MIGGPPVPTEQRIIVGSRRLPVQALEDLADVRGCVMAVILTAEPFQAAKGPALLNDPCQAGDGARDRDKSE